MDTNTLSSNIRSARLRSNLSQAELAKLLSKSQTTVAAWETGRSQPDASTIIRLCDVLNVSADQLLGLTTQYGEGNTSASQIEILRTLKWFLILSDMGIIVPRVLSDDHSEWLHEAELKEPINKLLLIHCQIKELKQLAVEDFSEEVCNSLENIYYNILLNATKTIADKYTEFQSNTDSTFPNIDP